MNIHDSVIDDDVNGVIIGRFVSVGQLQYNGRNQRGRIYGDSESDVVANSNLLIKDMENELGESFLVIFPDKNGWRLKILQ